VAASKAHDGLNDPARAVAEAEAALAIDARYEPAHLQLGQIFLTRNTPAAAAEIFSEAARLFPDSFLARLGKGLALKELQRYDEATAELRFCLERQPSSGTAFDALATVYLHAAKFEELSTLAEARVKGYPADFRGYYYLAAARDGQALSDEATLELLDQSLQRNASFAAALGLKGKLLLRRGHAAEAIQLLERAVALRRDHVPSHMALANAYRKLGRQSDAAREFQAVRELLAEQQQKPALRYHRGAP
jgi:tetratricopeptide (TPR) repeat protein